MPLTLGLTGMDPATEAALKSAFEQANARLQARWTLCDESLADHVIVDMDSMYGPMSWLRLHAGGKHVIGLTSAPRTQTAFRLGRPFDGEQMGRLLVDLAAHDGVVLDPAATAASSAPVQAAVATAGSAAPAATMPAPATDRAAHTAPGLAATPTPSAPDSATSPPAPPAASAPPGAVEAESAPAAAETAATETAAHAVTAEAGDTPDQATPTAAADGGVARAASTAAGDPSASAARPAAPTAPEPPAPPREPVFADWLVPGALTRRVRYQRASGPTLYIDPAAQVWHGPTPLKPIAGYFDGNVAADAFEPVDEVTWTRDAAAAGAAQPLVRLRWLGGLVAGRGELLPGFDPDGRYQLTKWPQTEREYPKHFRIATAMMKGPATVAEIAEASGMPAAEVADFFNANLATGFVEFVPEPPPAVPEPPKPTGLFGRLRNR